VKSCGCLHKERTREAKFIHGMTGTKDYKAYQCMLSRCYNPNDKNYHNYGGRGISVCQRWRDSSKAFFDDMGPRPYGYELERVDNDGNYEPSNCIWATHYDQVRNRRTNDKYLYKGEMICLKDICTDLDLPYKTIQRRKKHLGWSFEDAISKPIKVGNNQYT
jgi:hypothetical protein